MKITKPLPTKAYYYYNRPYLVIHGDSFASAIKKAIKDPHVKRIKTHAGSIGHITDSTDVIQDLSLGRRLGAVYKATRKN